MTRAPTRRGVLRLGGTLLAAGTTVGLAGCSGGDGDGTPTGNDAESSSDALDVVPAGATSVTYADIGGMLDDGTVEGLMNKMLSVANDSGEEAPTNKQELLTQFENRTGLDPNGMREMVGFGKTPEMGEGETPAPDAVEAAAQYSGTWFTADWSEDDLVNAVEESGEADVSLESSTYGEYTIYEPSSSGETMPEDGEMETPTTWLGVITDGEYVTGTEDAVSDALDVAAGDMDGVGSDLRDTYSGVRDGLAKMASSVPANLPEDMIPDESVGEGGENEVEVDPARLEELQGGAVTLYTEGDEMGLSASMTAGTEDAAQHVVDLIDGLIVSIEKNLQGAGQTATPPEDLVTALDNISVQRSGQSVSVEYTSDLESLNGLIEQMAELFLVTGEHSPGADGSTTYGVSFPV